MPGKLQDKIALITGAGSGIGRATSLVFAREGAKIVVADVVTRAGEETVRLIKAAGGEATFVAADVAKSADAEALVARTVATYGRLDCAFNNAGIEGDSAGIVDCSEENFDRIISINLKGVWLCLRAELPQMLKQGGGAIVNTASVAGLVGSPQLPAYVASKHGVIGLTKSAALEFAPRGVRVNAVCPGVINTPMVERLARGLGGREALVALEPVGRLGQPAEIGETVAWLCSDAASFVTGVAMPVDGGFVAQ